MKNNIINQIKFTGELGKVEVSAVIEAYEETAKVANEVGVLVDKNTVVRRRQELLEIVIAILIVISIALTQAGREQQKKDIRIIKQHSIDLNVNTEAYNEMIIEQKKLNKKLGIE